MRYAFLPLLAMLITSQLVGSEPPVPHVDDAVSPVATAEPQKGGQPVTMILVKLEVLEVSRAELKRLGFSFQTFDKRLAGPFTPGTKFNPANAALTVGLGSADGAGLVKALCREGVAKVLAEPSVVTVDRRPASYFAGSEVRAPGKQADAGEKPRYRRVGTELDFMPALLDDGRLRLELRASVSQLDAALDMVVDGDRWPGIRTVEVDTGLEMEFGQTAVIAGLVQRRATPTGAKPPNDAVEYDQVETVFLVTPERVKALAPARLPRPAISR